MRALIFAMLFAMPSIAEAQIVTGNAQAVDGDSLEFVGTSVRLFGVDAPEAKQTCQRDGATWPCGKDAADQLSAFVHGKQVSCARRDTDRYGRMVAVCHADGVDLGLAMVEAGLAVALPQFSQDYVELEARVRELRIGIWASAFQTPAEYRAANPRAEQFLQPRNQAVRPPQRARPARQSFSGCVIKGNRNRRGEWIYHLPGMPYYDATRPEEIFCTEAQAQAAGYRRAIVRPR